MKKKIIILVEILLLIVFLRSDFAVYYLDNIRSGISNKMDSLSKLPEKRELNKLRESILSSLTNFNDAQKDYLNDIAATKDTLSRFYYLYCVNKDINPYIFGQNLSYTCREINRSGILKS